MEEQKVIFFYREKDAFGIFSNFYPAPIELDGTVWPTNEHYFQAMKFEGTKHVEEIRNMKNPFDAAVAGRDRNRPLRKDWEQVKDSVMEKALEAKFTQHKDYRAILLKTGNATIVEHTRNDNYWADGTDQDNVIGPGKNMLGKLLMKIRDAILQRENK